MTILLLIRHGENDVMRRRLAGRTPGVSLNAAGQRQAQDLAEALKQAPLKAVYSSPLERAVETAQPLAESHGLTVQVRPALIEIDYGMWQGRTYKQLGRTNLWKKLTEKPSEIRFPGGETFLMVQQRVAAELDSLARAWQLPAGTEPAPQQVIAVVAHADIVRLALAHFLNMALDDFLRLTIAPASVSAVQIDGNSRPKVLNINHAVRLSWPDTTPVKKERRKKSP